MLTSMPGAGQAGLTIHARLKMLGVSTLIIDSCDEIGDSWRSRYHQLVLHDPIWYDQMPYLPFPSFWPIYTPKDKLAGYFQAYAQLLELNIWTRTTIEATEWIEIKKEWSVTVKRRYPDGRTETRILRPKHVVQATGYSGKKNQPDFKGWENFEGGFIGHSSEFKGAGKYGKGERKGKKAVVIGSCNSATDIVSTFRFPSNDFLPVFHLASPFRFPAHSASQLTCRTLLGIPKYKMIANGKCHPVPSLLRGRL
jgi:cation diffusion facilitator CzcD-associated flavoprotein CzcO